MPWQHYVPIRSDMSDLEEKIAFVLNPENEGNVTDIARHATKFAESLEFDSESSQVHALIHVFMAQHMRSAPSHIHM